MDGQTHPPRAGIARTTSTGRVLALAPRHPVTLRERIDRELRAGLRAAVRRLPSDRWRDVMRGRTQPFGVAPKLWIEADEDGADLDVAEACVVAAVRRSFALVRAARRADYDRAA